MKYWTMVQLTVEEVEALAEVAPSEELAGRLGVVAAKAREYVDRLERAAWEAEMRALMMQ